MSDARGIHDHVSMKLGRRPHDPTRPKLKLKDILTGVLPPVPATANYLSGLRFGLYQNDTYGDCGPTSVANSRILVTSRLTPTKVHIPTLAGVLDLYKRSGNPNFPRDDNGVVMQDMLAQVQSGGIDGVKCLAYASVNPKDPAELNAAIAIFGETLLGVTLQTAQQSQTDSGTWDYKQSAVWGGHAVLGGAEGPVKVITWAQGVTCTQAFLDHQLDEVWVVIWPEHITDQGFLTGVDLNKLAAAYTTLTGDPFPSVPTPPVPVTTPAPKPVTTPAPIPVTTRPPVTPPAPVQTTPPPFPPIPVPPVNWSAILALLEKNFSKALPVLLADLPAVLAKTKSLQDLYTDLLKAILFSAPEVKLALSADWQAVLKKYATLLMMDVLSGKSLADIEVDLAKALAA